jgi:hypothetical protein
MITDHMTLEAAHVLALHVQSQTPLTADEREHGRPAPDPTPWLPLARQVLEAAVVAEREEQGGVFDAERAALQRRLDAQVLLATDLAAKVERLEKRVRFSLPETMGPAA